MLSHFGWKAATAVMVNATVLTLLFRQEIAARGGIRASNESPARVPLSVIFVHVAFLSAVVLFAHHSVVFMGLFLFFLGYTEAYRRHQDRLFLREGLLVAFFLAGLVTLGGLQKWWLQPMLGGVDHTSLYFLATALTAITDNAALTYLGSLIDSPTPEFQYALVAGAVTGGGLTVIANAPNPAGFAILKGHFRDGAISTVSLLLAAIPPTCITSTEYKTKKGVVDYMMPSIGHHILHIMERWSAPYRQRLAEQIAAMENKPGLRTAEELQWLSAVQREIKEGAEALAQQIGEVRRAGGK